MNDRIALLLFPSLTRLVVGIAALTTVFSAAAAPSKQSTDQDARLAEYLSASYSAQITEVNVDEKSVRIAGVVPPRSSGVMLAEVPIWADPTNLVGSPAPHALQPDPTGKFTLTTERSTTLDGKPHDRLASRWAVVTRNGDGWKLLSAARWCENPEPPAAVPPVATIKSKKGIGGFHAGPLVSDLDELNIGAVTVNVVLTGIMSTSAGPGKTAFTYAGRQWWTNNAAVERLDRTLAETSKRNVVVSAIILIPPAKSSATGSYAKLIAHPLADAKATFALPNLDDREGVAAYAAGLAFLTERYGRAGGTFGRIHHYILHNEVDMGWVWANAGEQPMRVYLEMVHRSMRLAHLLARRFDPHAKAFISLTHHWAKAGGKNNYASRDLLDLMLTFGRVEGDFEWAIAHHPYPQDLRNPRVWEDNQATFTFDTNKITFKNIEVLDAWVKQPRALYRGKTVRTIHLSEQGLNSPDYSEKSLTEQAAGMAYAWNKIRDLSSIEAFQYHNWVDNRHEGGLRIGLRRFPDDDEVPHEPKPIYRVYRAIGTEDESKVCERYLGVVGVKRWEDVRYKGEIR